MSTTEKRLSYDYRGEYFKKNPGIFGFIWFCSQCGRPLFGRSHVQVDHIVPLKSIAGVNRTFNTVAICPKCNKRKSAKVGVVTVKGILAKLIEVAIGTTQKVLVYALVILIKVLSAPITKPKNALIKIAFAALYVFLFIKGFAYFGLDKLFR